MIRSLLIWTLTLCTIGVFSQNALAQSPDGLIMSVDQALRFMRSANYSEDDMVRRLAWTDKLVSEMVNYRPSDDDRQNYMRLLDLAVNHFQDENIRLRVLLRAVTTLDPLVQRYFPQWVVQDEAMILEIMRKIRDNRDDLRDAEAVEIADRVLTGKARLRVVQSPKDQENLIGIIIEKARSKNAGNPESAGFITNVESSEFDDYRIVGRKNLRDVLTQDLYERVVSRWEYAHLMETGVIKPEPYVAEATIGIPFGGGFMWTLESDERTSGVEIQVTRIRAGFELKIGNEWVNLPFLYGPQWNALFVYEPSRTEYIKLGPSIPFTWGDMSIHDDFPLFKARKLNGTWGAAGEYFKQLSIPVTAFDDGDGIGAAAYVSFGLPTLGNKKITNANGLILNQENKNILVPLPWEQPPTDPKERKAYLEDKVGFYYMPATATAYYWRDLNFLMSGLRIHAGIGYQKVNHARRRYQSVDGGSDPVLVSDTVHVMSGDGTLDLYAKLAYNHRGRTTYGASLQYFNGGLMGELYLNIFSWMRAEVRYSRIVFRDPEKWEHQEMIVPGLRLGFSF